MKDSDGGGGIPNMNDYLVLSSNEGEVIDIASPDGHKLEIVVSEICGNNVRIGIRAPKNFEINRREHTYRIDGRRVPSVTEIINSVLPYDYGPGIGEWHMARGTATHHGCQLLDEGRLDWNSVDPEIKPRIRAWEKFRRDWPAEMVACEQPLAHAKCGYAGTLDRLFERAGEQVICDLKNSVSPQVRLQLAGYSLAWTANGGRVIGKAVAVELSKNGGYKCHWMSKQELRRAEQQWLALLTVYGFMAEHNLLRKS